MRKHSGMFFIVVNDNDFYSSFIRKSLSNQVPSIWRMMMDEVCYKNIIEKNISLPSPLFIQIYSQEQRRGVISKWLGN